MQHETQTTEAPALFSDLTQQRYELIRPLLLDPAQTAAQRAQETGVHPDTVGHLKRQFAQQGMLGLAPATHEVRPGRRQLRVPEAVVQALQRLKGLYAGFGGRELARIIFHTTMYRMTGQTARRLWERLPPADPPARPLLDYHSYPERAQARQEVITLYAHGWSKRSISQYLQVSRTTITRWLTRFEQQQTASLLDHSSAPHTPARKVWLPVMLEIYHLQKCHPDAGGFRIWSLRGKTDLSVRTIERIMALNRQVYRDIPGTAGPQGPPAAPQPHPFKATRAHEYWFIDGRMMDFALQGHRWWSLIILDGYSRTMLAGATAPSEASWIALTVLYTACQRYGLPVHLISDSGGAFTSTAFEGVCTRLAIDHQTIVSTQGQSYMNLMETHFNIQRRLYDYQLALTRTPQEFDAAHQRFLALYNTTAHQGLLKERFASPIPLHVLGASTGRQLAPQDLTRKFAQALFIRVPNRYGCVTLHHSHFYVDQGLAHTPIDLWVTGEDLRAVYDQVLLAEYTCHYHRPTGRVTDLRLGQWYPSAFAARQAQGTLVERTPQDSVVVQRPPAAHRPAGASSNAEQLGLFRVLQRA
ncbi:MAG: helix-turn-helix domain-containing protein [Candidatus Tectimicrobiota bacterium]